MRKMSRIAALSTAGKSARGNRHSHLERGSHSMATRGKCEGQRQRLAYESARMLSELGADAFDRARRKAAARLGVNDRCCWPDNEEIRQALLQQQRLFHADKQDRTLADLRQRALTAMREFSAFAPRLVGQTVDGTASLDAGVHLQLFADSPEEIALDLLQRGIPWQQRDDQFRYAGGSSETHPVFGFIAGGIPVHLIVLPHQARRNPPLSPVSGRPERGIGAAELSRLIAAAE